MDEPTVKKDNTIGITYLEGEIEDQHFGQIIEDILGVPEKEIDGIDDRGTARFIFKVLKPEIYENICEHFVGRDIRIGRGNVIQVDDISSYGTMIEISRVPFGINNNVLTAMLKRFGHVYKCQSYFRQYGKYRRFNKSGKRRVWMKLKEHIPQTLTINQTQSTINVEYLNQPMSCNTCGNAGHRARNCATLSKDFKHFVDIDMNEASGTDTVPLLNQNVIDNASDTDMDIHFDPSQPSKPIECPPCNYKCKYDNILSVHMKKNLLQVRNVIIS